MARLNDHYDKLQAGYLFPEIARRVAAWTAAQPAAASRLIRCGIGDVTEPLPQAAIDALKLAADELGQRESFHGYGPDQGYAFLREAIAADYASRGVTVAAEEIFVSDGAKCDTGNILDIFGPGNRIGVPDPVYPVYVDTNVMAGNTGDALPEGGYAGLTYLEGNRENGFVPEVPAQPLDLVYLCFPNNPTGAVATRAQLKAWVRWANQHGAILLYDAAYEAFIQDPEIPRSIFEIEGARTCAIEFRSFSKDGGFTGVRCAFTVVPAELEGTLENGEKRSVRSLWARRMATKFNQTAYPVQRAAAALFSDAGRTQVRNLIDHYMGNARLLVDACRALGLEVFGGENAPYVWVKCPAGLGSWETFDKLLTEAQVVITPGAGFGRAGEGFFRISAFNSRANVEEVCRRLNILA